MFHDRVMIDKVKTHEEVEAELDQALEGAAEWHSEFESRWKGVEEKLRRGVRVIRKRFRL